MLPPLSEGVAPSPGGVVRDLRGEAPDHLDNKATPSTERMISDVFFMLALVFTMVDFSARVGNASAGAVFTNVTRKQYRRWKVVVWQ